MNKSTIIFAVIFGLLISLYAWEEVNPDINNKKNPERKEGIDHLVPVNFEVIHPGFHLLQYVVLPSRGTAEMAAVCLDVGTDKYFIRTWDPFEFDDLLDVESFSSEIEIPKEIASLYYDIWVNATFEVRYSKYSWGGLDGTSYVFSSSVRGLGLLCGLTWEPHVEAPPKWMVEAGNYLFELAKQKDINQDESVARLQQIKSKLFAYWQTNGESGSRSEESTLTTNSAPRIAEGESGSP